MSDAAATGTALDSATVVGWPVANPPNDSHKAPHLVQHAPLALACRLALVLRCRLLALGGGRCPALGHCSGRLARRRLGCLAGRGQAPAGKRLASWGGRLSGGLAQAAAPLCGRLLELLGIQAQRALQPLQLLVAGQRGMARDLAGRLGGTVRQGEGGGRARAAGARPRQAAGGGSVEATARQPRSPESCCPCRSGAAGRPPARHPACAWRARAYCPPWRCVAVGALLTARDRLLGELQGASGPAANDCWRAFEPRVPLGARSGPARDGRDA